MSVPWNPHFGSIPLYVDEGIDGIFLINFREPAEYAIPRSKPYVVGSTQSFGEMMAWNLALAYHPFDAHVRLMTLRA